MTGVGPAPASPPETGILAVKENYSNPMQPPNPPEQFDSMIRRLRSEGKVHVGFHPPGFQPSTCLACQSEQPIFGKVTLELAEDQDGCLVIIRDSSYNLDGTSMAWVMTNYPHGDVLSANLGEKQLIIQRSWHRPNYGDIVVLDIEIDCPATYVIMHNVPRHESLDLINRAVYQLANPNQACPFPAGTVVKF